MRIKRANHGRLERARANARKWKCTFLSRVPYSPTRLMALVAVNCYLSEKWTWNELNYFMGTKSEQATRITIRNRLLGKML